MGSRYSAYLIEHLGMFKMWALFFDSHIHLSILKTRLQYYGLHTIKYSCFVLYSLFLNLRNIKLFLQEVSMLFHPRVHNHPLLQSYPLLFLRLSTSTQEKHQNLPLV